MEQHDSQIKMKQPRINPISVVILCTLLSIAGCSAPPKRVTLRDVDVISTKKNSSGLVVKPKSEEEIKQAYSDYLKYASKNDKSRLDALQRLAQLEFDLSEKMIKSKGVTNDNTEQIEDEMFQNTLNRTVELLQTALRDYPNAKDNDRALYQLAKAYDQRGEHDKSVDSLIKLVNKYPNSTYYVESQFRLAEENFSAKKYSKAEDTYTDIIVSKKGGQFYEKALYKRGWSRFKQDYYQDAIEDFVKVINLNNFDDKQKLSDSQQQIFNEYFRALGLSFAYAGGPDQVNTYFSAAPDFKHLYSVFASVSDVYLKQQRYSDAVATLESFIKNNNKSKFIPEAYLKVINAWQQGGFSNQAISAVDSMYENYRPTSTYWVKNPDPLIYNQVRNTLKDYIVAAASTLHKEYQKTKKEEIYLSAKKWYDRYMENYASTARKDNIQFLYADLLAQHKNSSEALKHYETAAYDSDIILNKDAAYETVILTGQIYKSLGVKEGAEQLVKLLKYSKLYAQLYPTDPRTTKIISFAAEMAYGAENYNEAIKLAELVPTSTATAESSNLNLIRAHSYFKLKKYKEAESTYLALMQNNKFLEKNRAQVIDNLAISIYYQAAVAVVENRTNDALRDYTRIASIAPTSSIAATGLYDGISLAITKKLWNEAIGYIKQFQSLYPNHPQSNDIAKKLSVAYLSSNQDINAANELVKLSRKDQDTQYTSAALWKAAELYESKNDIDAAINSFADYAKRFPTPYPQYLEAMHKLTQLNALRGDSRQAGLWREKIINADKLAQESDKTDRTRLIASSAALVQAKQEYDQFASIRLTQPLERSLRKKKLIMQNAVNLYGRVSAYGVAETATEATHNIAEIYREFSKALMDSERPRNLKQAEQDQYKMLLEDQAFPFEEKAIEFYEANLVHVKDGINDEWIQKSLSRLKELYPARYKRDNKLDGYINALH